ncbi:MAG: 50S ribosomal protein L17, partial [Fibrobacterota bacterium]
MRHLVKKKKLGRTYSHRKAMLSNLAASIIDKERVRTTHEKAKEVRKLVDRLVTYAKKGEKNVHAIRTASKYIKDKGLLHKLFSELGPRYSGRNGGYTRVLKIGERKGDNALMSMIELVGALDTGASSGKKSSKKKTSKKKTSSAG